MQGLFFLLGKTEREIEVCMMPFLGPGGNTDSVGRGGRRRGGGNYVLGYTICNKFLARSPLPSKFSKILLSLFAPSEEFIGKQIARWIPNIKVRKIKESESSKEWFWLQSKQEKIGFFPPNYIESRNIRKMPDTKACSAYKRKKDTVRFFGGRFPGPLFPW